MWRWTTTLILIGAVGALAARARADVGSYEGEWAYQALNTKDTHFKVEQKGGELLLYRILYPDPQDPSYRLEHLYKGRIEGKKVSGKMFVREKSLDDFEFLRAWNGELVDKNRMVIDDLPLERFSGSDRENPLSTITKVTIQREPPAAEKKTAAKPSAKGKPAPIAASSEASPQALAPQAIPSITPVAMKIPVEEMLKIQTMIDEADKLFSGKKYEAAADRYQEALTLAPQKVEVLYKLGWSYGTLGSLAERKKDPQRAAGYFRQALEYWEKAFRYDPYNKGTAENIRRAKERLSKIQ